MGINANTTMELWFQDNYVDLMSDGTSRWIVVSTEMFIIPDDRRTNVWIPSTGNSASFFALDYSGKLPVGTRVAKIFALLQQNGVGEATLHVRRTGSSDTGDAQLRVGTVRLPDADSTGERETSIFDIEVTADLEFDYKVSTTSGSTWMNARGYRLG